MVDLNASSVAQKAGISVINWRVCRRQWLCLTGSNIQKLRSVTEDKNKNHRPNLKMKFSISSIKAYDSVRREVLYNILVELGIPKKLVRLIKVCLTERIVESG